MIFERLRKLATILILLTILSNNVAVHALEDKPRWEVFQSVSSSNLIKNLENQKRRQAMQPDRVLDAFGVKKGEILADVGAGTGYFSFLLATRVGVEGKVYAVEIKDELLNFIRKKMEENKVTNIIPTKASVSDPNLPPACCDKIMVINTYNFIADRSTYLKNMRKALKPGGVVAIIDIDATKVKPKKKIPFPSAVIEEMKHAGFVFRESHSFLATRYYLVFSAVE